MPKILCACIRKHTDACNSWCFTTSAWPKRANSWARSSVMKCRCLERINRSCFSRSWHCVLVTQFSVRTRGLSASRSSSDTLAILRRRCGEEMWRLRKSTALMSPLSLPSVLLHLSFWPDQGPSIWAVTYWRMALLRNLMI